MKYTLLLLVFLWISPYAISQSVQNGRVFEQNSGFAPLPGVQFDIKDAAPEVSNQEGYFHLNFSRKKKGQILLVNSISKADYVIVNQRAVDQWSFSPETEFKVVMSLKSKFEQSLKDYYHIGYTNYKSRYNSVLSQLKAEREREKLNEKEYNTALDSVRSLYKGELESLDYYADIFARINKDELNGIDLIAMRLVDEGKLDSAITVYENERFFEKFTRQWEAVRRLTTEIKTMIPSLRNYADMCAFAGGRENYQKVDKVLELIAESDTTDYNNGLSYYNYLYRQKQYKKATIWGERMLRISKNEDERSNVASTLVFCYYNIMDVEKVGERFHELQSFIEKGFEDIDNKALTKWSESLLAFVLIIKELPCTEDGSLVEVLLERYENFIEVTKKAQKSLIEMDVDISLLYNSVNTYLIPYLLNQNKIKEAKKHNDFLTQFYDKLNRNSKSKIQEEALLLNEDAKAVIYHAEGNKELARSCHERLNGRFKELYNSNPELYAQSYVQYLCYWAENLYDLGRFEEALLRVEEAMDILGSVDLYEQSVNLGAVYFKLFGIAKNIYPRRDMLDRQELAYEKMYNIYEVYNKIPAIKEVMMDGYYDFISEFSQIEIRLNKPEKSKSLINSALLNLKNSEKTESNDWTRSLLYHKLGNIYHTAKNDSAIINYNKSKALCDSLMNLDKDKYLIYKIYNLNSLGAYYRDYKSDSILAFKSFNESLALSKQVSSTDSIQYIGNIEIEFGNTYWRFGDMERYKAHFRKALKYYILGLALKKERLEYNHPDMAASYETIGNLYRSLEDYPSALEYCIQALQVYTALYKNEHYSIIVMNNMIGDLYFMMQQYEKALEYFTNAFTTASHLLPEGHLGIAEIYNFMSKVYYAQGKYEMTLDCLKHILNIYLNQKQEMLPNMADVYSNIGYIYTECKDYAKAKENTLKAKTILDVLVVEDKQYNLLLSQALGNLSYYSLLEQQFDEAKQYAEQALITDSSQTWIKTNLVLALLFTGKYEEAEKMLDDMKNVKLENGNLFNDAVAEDIETFEKAGIVPQSVLPYINELKTRLKQPTQGF